MSKTFGTNKCYLCGREISINGMAQYSHNEKHVREGLLIVSHGPYSGRGYSITEKGLEAERKVIDASRNATGSS